MNQGLFSPPRNFAGISPPYSDWENSRVVVLPVPYDSTTDWRSGTRDGPQAIIDASQYLELYDLELEQEIYKVGIHTLPEVQPDVSSPENMAQRVYTVAKELLGENKMVLMLGGEHSLTLGMVKAYRERHEALSVLQPGLVMPQLCGELARFAPLFRWVFVVCVMKNTGLLKRAVSNLFTLVV